MWGFVGICGGLVKTDQVLFINARKLRVENITYSRVTVTEPFYATAAVIERVVLCSLLLWFVSFLPVVTMPPLRSTQHWETCINP